MRKFNLIVILMLCISLYTVSAVNVTIADDFENANVNWSTFTAEYNTSFYYEGSRSARVYMDGDEIENTSISGTSPFNFQFAYYSPPEHTYISSPGIRLKNGADRVVAITGGYDGFGQLGVYDGTATYTMISPLNFTNEWVFYDIMYYASNESCNIRSHYKDNATIENVDVADCTQNDHDDITQIEFIEQSSGAGDVYFLDAVKLCSGGVCPPPPAGDTSPPVLTQNSPNSTYNETYNVNVYVNITADENMNCSINNSYFSIYSFTGTFISYNETELSDGFHSVNINCSDAYDNMANLTVWFYKDESMPYISKFNAENITNVSSIFSMTNEKGFGFNYTFTDNLDLYSFQYNITYVNDTLIFNETESISGIENISLNYFSMTEYLNTTYRYKTKLCDSHTSTSIKDANKIKNDDNWLNFTFDNTIISISVDYANSVFSYDKLDDRYTIDITQRKGDPNIFYLMSNKPIDYIRGSHFVIGDYWIDFEPYKTTVSEENGYYSIRVLSEDETLSFKSIGALNCVYKDYTISLESSQYTSGYGGSDLIGFTNWFDFDIFVPNTTAGVLMFFFSLAIIIALVVLSEYTTIPIIAFLTGLLGFFIGILYFVSVSAIIGLIFTILSTFYMMRAVFLAK